MKSKSTRTGIFIGGLALVAAIILPLSADAQVLRNQTRYSKSQVSQTISRLENSSDKFRGDFDNAMDRSRRNGSNAEDRYNNTVGNFEDALDRLRNEFDRNNRWWESRNDVRQVMDEARNVNQMMNSISFRRSLERQWNAMRNDINSLADTYDLAGLNGGGWSGGDWNGGGNNNGGWNGGGQMSAPPSWARGTFYGTAPDGSQITLTMSNNGQVTAVINGSASYGTYNRGGININGDYARVTQSGNGLRTTRTDNGEVIVYSRSGYGSGDGGGYTGGRPVNWAVGSFSARNPQSGGTIYITIAEDGMVTVNMDGNVSYGTMNGSTFTKDGATATVTRNGNGIRMTRTDNGERIDYRRQ